jgi:hypothetical protein
VQAVLPVSPKRSRMSPHRTWPLPGPLSLVTSHLIGYDGHFAILAVFCSRRLAGVGHIGHLTRQKIGHVTSVGIVRWGVVLGSGLCYTMWA